MEQEIKRLVPEELERNWIPHLRGQFEQARPILFTGAGFSLGVRNIRGEPMPSYDELKRQLWNLSFPGEPLEAGTRLQDVFEDAALRHKRKLCDLLVPLLTVDVDSIPDWYKTILSFPWQRCYTLNIDDLPSAVSRKFKLSRKAVPISATNPRNISPSSNPYRDFECVYLNGSLADLPDNVTFSVSQYAERLARPDPWYIRCSADLLTSPTVFIGTRLDEPPLWQHLTLRGESGGREMSELRHRSYLIIPTLDRARRALLAKFNVVWLPMTGEEFVSRVLSRVKPADTTGHKFLAERGAVGGRSAASLPEVTELAQNPTQQNEFLMGQEPIWADLQSNRAINREVDNEIWQIVRGALNKGDERGLVLIAGTAGSGKSTSLMRVCLRLTAEGTRVGWVDRNVDLSPGQIRAAMKAENAPPVLAIDDPDLYGTELAPLVRDLILGEAYPLVLLAIRSGKVDRSLNPAVLHKTPQVEVSMPHLGDNDIGALIDLLEREKRLGFLTGKPRDVQEAAFRDQAGRQLLVAMIQATSGRKFEVKAIDELADLQPDGRLVYAIIAVATAFRFGLSRDEILIACGEQSNIALNAVDQLIRRHIVVPRPDGFIWARHRVIADIIRSELQLRGQLIKPVHGLALLATAKVSESMPRSARPWRMLRVFINHDFLYGVGAVDFARNLYGSLENPLSSYAHFWLQRGSLEVEFGNVNLAELFLNTARSIAPTDRYVENEWAYFLFRKAIENPSVDAKEMVNEATRILEGLMSRGGDPYPYHVLGSQGLAWVRRGVTGAREKERYLRKLLTCVEEGRRKYPKEKDLAKLHEDLRREYMNVAVGRP
jgi:hypothetical protein